MHAFDLISLFYRALLVEALMQMRHLFGCLLPTGVNVLPLRAMLKTWDCMVKELVHLVS